MVTWDADGRKDLLAGLSDGTIRVYLNVATDEAPAFDAGTFLEVGPPGSKTPIDVGSRATPVVVDWNADGRKDLVVGSIDGKIRLYLNEGADTAPDFRTTAFVADGAADLLVPSGRSSPFVVDVTGDGRKDLLTGNTSGQLLLFGNVGSEAAPAFTGYVFVESDGVPIDLPLSARSRPTVADWNADGTPDVLLGSGDGLVRLYLGIPDGVGVRPGPWNPTADRARLLAAFPNPFRPGTTIPFVLAESGRVRLAVLDAQGRLVARVADRAFGRGAQAVPWDGRDLEGRPVPAGTYFVRMEAEGRPALGRSIVRR